MTLVVLSKTREKESKQVLERSDGVLDFSSPKFRFEQGKVNISLNQERRCAYDFFNGERQKL